MSWQYFCIREHI